MNPRLRKIVAALLSVWLLFMSASYVTAVAAEVEHDLQCVQLGTDAPPPSSGSGDPCPHGCAAHLAAHLFAASEYDADTGIAAPEAAWLPALDSGGFYSITSSLFLPPKVLLA